MSTTSPNMSLPVSTIGTDSGLIWEQNLNISLGLIDAHDHTPGKGVPITPSAMNITSDLDFQGHKAKNIYGLLFSGSAASSATGFLYTAPSSGGGINDLFYNDFAGNVIQVTKGGIVNVTAASIPGESYAGGTFIWTQTQSGFATTPANFDIGSITIRPNTAATTNGVVISPPAAISSLYNFVLPALPAVKSFMYIDNSGNVTTTQSITPIIPDNAGVQGNFLRQNASGGSTWSTQDSTVQVKTANYTLLPSDDGVLVSGGVFTITLPALASNIGKEYFIKKTDTSLTNIITIKGNASEDIGGFGNTVTLNTPNECWTIAATSTTWVVKVHETSSPEMNLGAGVFSSASAFVFTIASSTVTLGTKYTTPNGSIFTVTIAIAPSTTLTAFGTANPNAATNNLSIVVGSGTGPSTIAYSAVTTTGQPTKAATVVQDKWLLSRYGNRVRGRYDYYATGASGNAGVGNTFIYLPTGIVFDTTNMQMFTTIPGANPTAGPYSAIGWATTISLSSAVLGPHLLMPFNSNTFRDYIQGIGMLDPATAAINSAGCISYNFDFPVLGWYP